MVLGSCFLAIKHCQQDALHQTYQVPKKVGLQDLDYECVDRGFDGTLGTNPCLVFRVGKPFPLCQLDRDTRHNLHLC